MTVIVKKIHNDVTDTSAQVCYICGVTLKEMNDIKKAPMKKVEP